MSLLCVRASSEFVLTPTAFRDRLKATAMPITVSLRTKRSSTGVAMTPFGAMTGTAGLIVRFNATSKLVIDTGLAQRVSTPSFTDTASWHSYDFVINGAGSKIYADGVLQADNGVSVSFSGSTITDVWAIGCLRSGGASSSYYDGRLAEAAVFARELSSTEIANKHTLGWGADHLPGLIGYWRLDQTSGTVANGDVGLKDHSGYGQHATLGTAPDWSSDEPTLVLPTVQVLRPSRLAVERALRRSRDFWRRWRLREWGPPVSGRVNLWTRVWFSITGPEHWVIHWDSNQTGGPFYVYVDGRFHRRTWARQMHLTGLREGLHRVEVLIDPAVLPTRFYNDRVRLGWRRVEGVKSYRIEEWTGSAWERRRTLLEQDKEYYEYTTPPLADDTTYQWRVIAVGINGQESAAAEFSGLMVREPDALMDQSRFSYSGATQKVTVSA